MTPKIYSWLKVFVISLSEEKYLYVHKLYSGMQIKVLTFKKKKVFVINSKEKKKF